MTKKYNSNSNRSDYGMKQIIADIVISTTQISELIQALTN